MSDHFAALSLHEVAAKEAEIGFRVFLFNRSHEVRRVQVARSFARYYKVFHMKCFLLCMGKTYGKTICSAFFC
jgi:hypothetical protein